MSDKNKTTDKHYRLTEWATDELTDAVDETGKTEIELLVRAFFKSRKKKIPKLYKFKAPRT